MRRHPLVLVLALVLGAVACGDGDSDVSTDPAADQREDLDAFCDRADRLTGERPESYMGSDEHIEDVTDLAELAPAEIRPEAERFRDFLADDFDRKDPDANLIENYPAAVRTSVEKMQAYLDDRC